MISHALCLVTDPQSQTYPIRFVSRSLDWLAWLGLAGLALAWLVSSAAATRTATIPEQASTTSAPRLSFYMLALELWLFLWLLLMRRATLRQGQPSQARQANQGIDSQIELDIFCDVSPARKPLTNGCGTGCIQSVNGPCSGPVRGGNTSLACSPNESHFTSPPWFHGQDSKLL